MFIPEARSFDKGIEFYGKDIVIVATRKDGKVIISKSKSPQLKEKKSYTKLFSSLLFTCIGTNILYYLQSLEDSRIRVLGLVFLGWLDVICYYFVSLRTKDLVQTHKYHAAEHKALNYIDKYSKAPETCDDLMKMSSISYRCGSTVLVVIMILLTLCISGFLYIPNLAFKIIWVAISTYITLYLWANDKCNFLQKFVIVEPTCDELEVALLGVKEYLKIK